MVHKATKQTMEVVASQTASPEERAELIRQTVEYYGADPQERRSVDPWGACKYRTKDGRKCAIGRLLADDEVNPSWDFRDNDGGSGGKTAISLMEDGLLPERVARLGARFLSDLQELHDREENWNLDGPGLTKEGKRAVAAMLKRWGPQQ